MADASPTPYIGLARQYRPQTFADLVGQTQIANSMSQQVLAGKAAQAYIFCGSRGIGKTSTARILAKSLNCEKGPTPTPCGVCRQCVSITNGSSMDVIEIDGASNNGVDDIRELQETISQNPFAARKKIYIIDEVHMLSKGAFNALLKTLEEPPPFVVFIFATTEFEKIPETIKSRCQSFQFNRISIDDLIRRLDFVASAEGIEMDPGERHGIFEAIAFAVDGGMRDAMMALDQLRALGDGRLVLDDVVRFLGIVEHDLLLATVEMLHQRDTPGLLEMINSLVERGRDLERFIKNLLSFLRDLMVLKSRGGEELVNLTGEKMARAKALLFRQNEQGRTDEVLTYAELLNFLQVFMNLEAQIKQAVQVRIHIEFAFVKLTAIEPVVDIARLLENFDRIVGMAAPVVAASPVPQAAPPYAAPPAPPRPFAPPAPPVEGPPEPATPDLFGGMRQADAPPPPSPGGVAQGSPPLDAGDIWRQLMAHRQQFGMGLSLALGECQCLGIERGALRLKARKTFSTSCLADPKRISRVEAFLNQITGVALRVSVQLTASPPPVAAAAAAPSRAMVMHDSAPLPPPPPPPQGPPPVSQDASAEAYALYMRQDPTARARQAIETEPFRGQVRMALQFFEGALFDGAGNRIALES